MNVRTLVGPAVFVGLTLALALASSNVLAEAWSPEGAQTTRLLHASLLYAAVVGWQPLVALLVVRRVVDRTFVDRNRRTLSRRYTWFSIGSPIILLGAATLVDAWLGSTRPDPVAHPLAEDGAHVWVALCAFAGVLAVLWLQAIVEELAWRGYILPRLMQAFGAWPGLFLHGLLWGACYAPVFLVADAHGALPRILGFIVTGGLLGIILGWLRLASGSIAASVAFNATLTICAGLPLVLQGASPLLGAVFGPAGWLPMLALLALILALPPLRGVVVTPARRLPEYLN